MSGAVCRSCGAPVMWFYTANGKRMPLDPEPDGLGSLTIHNGLAVQADSLPFEVGPEVRYRSHFVTCPHADQHRRPR